MSEEVREPATRLRTPTPTESQAKSDASVPLAVRKSPRGNAGINALRPEVMAQRYKAPSDATTRRKGSTGSTNGQEKQTDKGKETSPAPAEVSATTKGSLMRMATTKGSLMRTRSLSATGVRTAASVMSGAREGYSTPRKRPAPGSASNTPTGEGTFGVHVGPKTPPPKRKKSTNKQGELVEDTSNDMYCWLCHKEGNMLCCELCPRVYHFKCLSIETEPSGDWVCPECEKSMQAECTDTRSKAMAMLTVDQLCNLLKNALQRMKHSGSEPFHNPVDVNQVPSYRDYVFYPMDLSTLEKNIKKKMYGSTEAFLADTKWILHNCVIFNGSHHKLTNSAKMIVKICRHEMNEIEICPDCYTNSCTKRNDNWFCEPCRTPHTLVWAKLKGYPFWPAKALREEKGKLDVRFFGAHERRIMFQALREVDGQVDVRFFGAHDRAWVPVSYVYLLSKECPTPVRNKKGGFDESMEELELHIQKIRDKFGSYMYAPFRVPYDSKHAYTHNRFRLTPKPDTKKAKSSPDDKPIMKTVKNKTDASPSLLPSGTDSHDVDTPKNVSNSQDPSGSKDDSSADGNQYDMAAKAILAKKTIAFRSPVRNSEKVSVVTKAASALKNKYSSIITTRRGAKSSTSQSPVATHADLDSKSDLQNKTDVLVKDADSSQKSLLTQVQQPKVSLEIMKNLDSPTVSQPTIPVEKCEKTQSQNDEVGVEEAKHTVNEEGQRESEGTDSVKQADESKPVEEPNTESKEENGKSNELSQDVSKQDVEKEKDLLPIPKPLETQSPSKGNSFFEKLEKTIASCRAKLGVTGDQDGPHDEDEEKEESEASSSDSSAESSDEDGEDEPNDTETHVKDTVASTTEKHSEDTPTKPTDDGNDPEPVAKDDDGSSVGTEDSSSDDSQIEQKIKNAVKEKQAIEKEIAAVLKKKESQAHELHDKVESKEKSEDNKLSKPKQSIDVKTSDTVPVSEVSEQLQDSASVSQKKDNLDSSNSDISKTSNEKKSAEKLDSNVLMPTETKTDIANSESVRDLLVMELESEDSDALIIDLDNEGDSKKVKDEPAPKKSKTSSPKSLAKAQDNLSRVLMEKEEEWRKKQWENKTKKYQREQAAKLKRQNVEQQENEEMKTTKLIFKNISSGQPTVQPVPMMSSQGSDARMPSPKGPTTGMQTDKGGVEPRKVMDFSEYTKKLTKSIEGTFQEFYNDLMSPEGGQNLAKHYRAELDKQQWQHQQELAEMKHNADLTLAEMRSVLDTEKKQAVENLKRKYDMEKLKAVEETKKKQWCANCGKEAIFYCCWNTSYCDYPCQQSHWPVHMPNCTQSQNKSQQDHGLTTGQRVTSQDGGQPASGSISGQELHRLQQMISSVSGPQLMSNAISVQPGVSSPQTIHSTTTMVSSLPVSASSSQQNVVQYIPLSNIAQQSMPMQSSQSMPPNQIQLQQVRTGRPANQRPYYMPPLHNQQPVRTPAQSQMAPIIVRGPIGPATNFVTNTRPF